MKRRSFIKQAAAIGVASAAFPALSGSIFETDFPVTQITSGAKQHWFGYYDKWQVDPTGRYALGNEIDLFFRSPQPEDVLRIGLIDQDKGCLWTEIGKSNAWSLQQGCMLQWIPGSAEEVIWNDREGDQFVARIYNIKTGKTRTLPKAVYALSMDGKYAIGTEFNRIQYMRPGYGYPGVSDPYENVKAPDEVGLYRMDVKTGEERLLFSYADIAKVPHQGEDLTDYWHYFNHLLVSPDSERFIFLHRWRKEMIPREERATSGFITRMFTVDKNGDNLYMLDPSGNTSHFIWQDSTHVCAWTKPIDADWGFYVFEDKTNNLHQVGKGVMTENGHNTYVPHTQNEWILNDTYPDKKSRKQTLYLYHVPTGRKIVLGRFYEPEKFRGEWRCDLHPRCNQQGTAVFFDSTHEGGKRQMYKLDITAIK